MLSLSTCFVIFEFCAHSPWASVHLVGRAGRSFVGGESASDKHIASGGMRMNDLATQLGHFPELKQIHCMHPPERAQEIKVRQG